MDSIGNTSSEEKSTTSAEDTTAARSSSPRRERDGLPKSNKEYGKQEYWEERFAKEDEFEWLVTYKQIESQLARFLTKQGKILVVGCGNSSFSSELYDAGYEHITSIDYSKNVIASMKEKNDQIRPGMEWVVMDMTDMSSISNDYYDVVIDKAAMDALMTAERDVWNPDQGVIDSSRKMCRHLSRILKIGGYHLHISFAQPHFRKKYLLGQHSLGQDVEPMKETKFKDSLSLDCGEYSTEFGWDYCVENIGDDEDGGFNHFLYIMKKHM